MGRFSIRAGAAIVMAVLAAGPAFADPASDACAFGRVLAKDGVDPAIGYLEGLAASWGEEQRSKLGSVVGPELARFNYRGAQVYQIADIPGSVEEFFLVMNLKASGSVYIRLLFEGNGGEPKFINIDFKATYYDILQTPFFQTPVAVDCS